MMDYDRQGTATKALGDADNSESSPDVTIYDTPGEIGQESAAVGVRMANVVLIVTSPSPADLWEADEAVTFAKSRNPEAVVRIVYNKVRKGTRLAKNIEKIVLNAPVLGASLSDYECYRHFLALGWEALEAAAQTEGLLLMKEVMQLK
jgi:chromosome partitioning protein